MQFSGKMCKIKLENKRKSTNFTQLLKTLTQFMMDLTQNSLKIKKKLNVMTIMSFMKKILNTSINKSYHWIKIRFGS